MVILQPFTRHSIIQFDPAIADNTLIIFQLQKNIDPNDPNDSLILDQKDQPLLKLRLTRKVKGEG